MDASLFYNLAADFVLFLHLAFALFVVVGLLLILAGGLFGWSWVQNPRFRLLHLLAIAVVVVQAWLGRVCPLTDIESALRIRAGAEPYAGAFVSHWMEQLLYYRAPEWVFILAYSLFAALVLAAWFLVRPRPFR